MLFLFDIDGTLLRRMPPAHRAAVCDGLRAVYGLDLALDDLGQTAGLTDAAIAARALRGAGLAPEVIAAGLADFYSAAAAAYERHVPADLSGYTTPHCREALDWLAARGMALGLVTGNIECIAWTKLRAARLADYFACGAFGDEAEAREELPPLALARAEQTFGRTFASRQIYVVGDTPADVACGAASGLRTVAVATGPIHSLEELHACGAEYAFEDLRGLLALEIGSPSA
jgi:phosphoglycolate phosphatase